MSYSVRLEQGDQTGQFTAPVTGLYHIDVRLRPTTPRTEAYTSRYRWQEERTWVWREWEQFEMDYGS